MGTIWDVMEHGLNMHPISLLGRRHYSNSNLINIPRNDIEFAR